MALFRPFEIDEIMSANSRKAEVISEKSENPTSMSDIRGQSRSVFRLSKTAAYDPIRTL
jgi:hypothetical protein